MCRIDLKNSMEIFTYYFITQFKITYCSIYSNSNDWYTFQVKKEFTFKKYILRLTWLCLIFLISQCRNLPIHLYPRIFVFFIPPISPAIVFLLPGSWSPKPGYHPWSIEGSQRFELVVCYLCSWSRSQFWSCRGSSTLLGQVGSTPASK